ncbi:MAG: hypothetical protein ACTH5B_05415 [Marinomonas sp.]|uniref:hypothetical protein n=1 Tax=Marinomonas sp. TaxID=1904862 RepID=UPI003F9AB455
MTDSINTSTLSILKTFDVLLEEPLEGYSLMELIPRTSGSKTGVNRALYTLEVAGWVESYKIKGTKAQKWKVAAKFLKSAHDYRTAVLEHIEATKTAYQSITGKEL